jgi:hypothetical protein
MRCHGVVLPRLVTYSSNSNLYLMSLLFTLSLIYGHELLPTTYYLLPTTYYLLPTGYSPFELVYGRKPGHPLRIHLDIGKEKEETAHSYGSRMAENLKITYEEVRQMQTRMALVNKEINSGKYKPVQYVKGDFVLYANPKKIKDPESTDSYRPQKLCWRRSMPYKITRRVHEWTYEISGDKQTLEAPANRLRLYTPWSDCCMETSPWLEEQRLEHEDRKDEL